MTSLFSGNCSLIFDPGVNDNVVYPKLEDLWSQLPLALVILVLRYVFGKYCFTPLGKWLQIDDTKRRPAPYNEVLEAAYSKSTKRKDLSSIAKKVDMTERQVERWWRLRRSQDKPSTLVKFTENIWKGTFISFNFFFGLYALWDKEWLWDMDKTMSVNSGISSDIWWYYTISSAFYWSLTLTHFWDVRRKDFWQMFVHHLATIALLSFSWVANLYRIGSIVLLLHDFSDVFLELGKATLCARLGGTTAVFVLFAASWVTSRLVLFPYWVLTRTTSQAYLCNASLIHFLNLMLWLLLVLHIIWTVMIFQIAYITAASGEKPKDIRSSSSESEELDPKTKNV